jgi:hypothetical protein
MFKFLVELKAPLKRVAPQVLKAPMVTEVRLKAVTGMEMEVKLKGAVANRLYLLIRC